MGNHLAKIKEFALYLIPFILLQVYIEYTYQISIWQATSWWIDNYSAIDSAWGYLFIFIFMFFLFFAPFTGIINTLYLGVFGEKQSLVYLGHSRESHAMYYKAEDDERTIIDSYDLDRKFNTDFAEIYRMKQFIKDPGTTNLAGTKTSRFHPYAILSAVAFCLCFFIPMLGAVHAVSYPAYKELYGAHALLQGDAMDAFDIELTKYHLTRASAAILSFASLLLALIFSWKIPRHASGQPAQELPSSIYSGNSIQGKPVGLEIEYKKIRNTHNSYDMIDSGFRYATLAFSDDFEPEVYVSLYFESASYPRLEGDIKEHIEKARPMLVRLNNELALEPDTAYVSLTM